MPARPRRTCWAVISCGCGWYQSVVAGWFGVNATERVSPGWIGSWGPPSAWAGMSMPCQWTVVSSSVSFVMTASTARPRCRRIVGPR